MAVASGFVLMGYDGGPANLLATSIAINLTLAPLIGVIASRRGHSGLRWIVIGLGFGMWALAVALIFLSPRDRYQSSAGPHPPHAA